MENLFRSKIENLSIAKEEFLKLLPLIPVFLTIISVFKLVFFYRSYGINITEYIDFSEFVTLNLYSILLYSMLFFLITALYTPLFNLYISSILTLSNKYIFLNIIAAILIYSFFVVFAEIKYLQLNTWVISLKIIEIISFSLIFFIPSVISGIAQANLRIVYSLYIIYFLLVISRSSNNLAYKISYANLKLQPYTQKIYSNFQHLKTDSEIITFDSLNYIIGKTKDYYFIENYQKKSIRIIPETEVKEANINIKNYLE